MFKKPQTQDPTCHLFVGNTRDLSTEQLEAVFAPHGAEHVVLLASAERPHAFVSFKTAEAASQALQCLRNRPSPQLGGRLLPLLYAEQAIKCPAEAPVQSPVALVADECAVPGLQLHTDWITAAQEEELLAALDGGTWSALSKRRVRHFGHKFLYETRNVDLSDQAEPAEPMPQAFEPMLQRLRQMGMPQVDQCTANEYPPGAGLSAHIDTHSAFTGAIASVSLAGHTVMEFRQGTASRALLVPARSLLVMSGESRLAWAHYIPHRKGDWVDGALVPRPQRRVSLTYREARGRPCDCSWPEFCDSQRGALPPTRLATLAQQATSPSAAATQINVAEDRSGDDCRLTGAHRDQAAVTPVHQQEAGPEREVHQQEAAELDQARDKEPPQQEAHLQRLEEQYVHSVYNAIAPHFSATRFAVWPKVRSFLEGLPTGAVVADVGCGNGKYFGVRSDIMVLGSDRSSGLARVAALRLQGPTFPATGSKLRADVAVADAFHLPYSSSRLDAVLCIAVLHHISSAARRLRMLEELVRVLKPGGRALVTVWATQQEDPTKFNKWSAIELAASDDASAGSGDSASFCTSRPPKRSSWATNNQQPSTDYFVPWHLPFHRAEGALEAAKAQAAAHNAGAANALQRPVHLDTVKQAVVFSRFYHVFEDGELDSLAEQLGDANVSDSFYDKDNWCIVLTKLNSFKSK